MHGDAHCIFPPFDAGYLQTLRLRAFCSTMRRLGRLVTALFLAHNLGNLIESASYSRAVYPSRYELPQPPDHRHSSCGCSNENRTRQHSGADASC